MIHLDYDAERFGVLNNFSTFPFESAMQPLLKSLRKSKKPLRQVAKRVGKKSLVLLPIRKVVIDFTLLGEHKKGPTMRGITNSQYFAFTYKG